MNWHNKSLKILGLTDSEIEVLKSLSLAKSTQDIKRLTGLSRTGIKYVLEKLIEKEMVEKSKVGKRFIYISISKKELSQKFKDIFDEINIEAGDLQGARIKTSKENEFIIHVGAKEIIPAYQRIASINKGERIKAIQHHKSWMELSEKVSKDQLVDFNKSIVKNHLILDGMLNESAYDSYLQEIKKDPRKHKDTVESLSGRMADYTVFPNDMFNYNCELWLFKSTTLLINWHEEVAIEITNQSMTPFLRDMFEFVKAGGRKIDHNKVIQGVLERV
jgi:predicted transcriptional regulator